MSKKLNIMCCTHLLKTLFLVIMKIPKQIPENVVFETIYHTKLDIFNLQYHINMNRLALLKQQISNPYSYTKLSVYYQNNIAYISLRSPKDLNCLSNEMLNDLCHAFFSLQNDSFVNVIVIISQLSKVFCAGADIKQFVKHDYESGARSEYMHTIVEAVKNVRKPLIAAVNGKALGGGFELALLCDIVLASEKAYFGFPQINLGLMPGLGGTQRFTKIVGQKKAMRHILTGQGLNAEQAYKLNIAEKVSSEKFNEEVHRIAESISSKALMATMLAKKSVKQASNTTMQQGLDYEKAVFYSMISTKAARQGTSAFINKRKPNFKGL